MTTQRKLAAMLAVAGGLTLATAPTTAMARCYAAPTKTYKAKKQKAAACAAQCAATCAAGACAATETGACAAASCAAGACAASCGACAAACAPT
ncbi:hypothetical protein [Parasphingorhabdus sp.]|uniref:hypothetical protein n=1 Tax=Parasphingorhabdus sp. TaxID=2709688 RepID=UPI00326454D8